MKRWINILLAAATVAAAVFVKNARSKQIVSDAEQAAQAALNANDQFTQARPIVSE